MSDMALRNLEKMLGSIGNANFERFIRHIERLGSVGVVFLGTLGLFRYANLFGPSAAWVIHVVGFVSFIGALGLLVIVGLYAWKDALAALPRPWLGHFIGIWVCGVTILLGLGGMLWALNPP